MLMPTFDKRLNSRRSPTIREVERKGNMNGKSKLLNPMANIAGMTTNWLVGGIKGKDRVNGLRKPKERGSKPYGPTWQE